MKIKFYKGGWVAAEVRKGAERDGTTKAISAHWVAFLHQSMTALQVAAWFSSWISSSRLLVGSRCSQASSAWGRKNSFTGCLSSQAGLFGLFSRVDTKTLYNLSSRRTFHAVPRWRAQGDRGIKRGICCSLYTKEIKEKLILKSGWAHLHEQDICHWWLLSCTTGRENTLPVACGSSLRRSFEDKKVFTVAFPPLSCSCSEITFPHIFRASHPPLKQDWRVGGNTAECKTNPIHREKNFKRF